MEPCKQYTTLIEKKKLYLTFSFKACFLRYWRNKKFPYFPWISIEKLHPLLLFLK